MKNKSKDNTLDKSDKKDVDPAITQFMLQEIQIAFERWKHTDQIDESRITSFLTLTSASLGIILLMTQLQAPIEAILNVGLVSFLFVWLVGINNFRMILKSNEVITKFIRIQNRARQYFIDLHSPIQKYLDYPISDDSPRFTRTSGKRNLMLIICSVFFGLLTGNIYSVIDTFQISLMSLLFGGIGLLVHIIVLAIFAQSRLQKLDADFDVRFPSTKQKRENT